MLPMPLDARRIDDESALQGSELVVFGEPPVFGISCRVKVGDEYVPGIVGFEEQRTDLGVRSFILTAAEVLRADESAPVCIALGRRFVVGFEPESVALHAPANPGDLVVLETGLHLLARVVANPPRNYLVNLETGEATKQVSQSGTIVRRWSISFAPASGGEPVVVFMRGG